MGTRNSQSSILMSLLASVTLGVLLGNGFWFQPTHAFTVVAVAVQSGCFMRTRTTASFMSLEDELEATVLDYFQGVHDKNAARIRQCFDETCIIRDVCALTNDHNDNTNKNSQPIPAKSMPADAMVQRCMEFVQAHPDVAVNFHIPPTCLRTTRQSEDGTDDKAYWVFAHWYETGTWTGTSCGLTPSQQPMNCEGQTRFRLDPQTQKIQELVVTRTFTQWEKALLLEQQQHKN